MWYVIYNVIKNTKEIATFHAHGHINFAQNTCKIDNVVKNTEKSTHVDLQMVTFYTAAAYLTCALWLSVIFTCWVHFGANGVRTPPRRTHII